MLFISIRRFVTIITAIFVCQLISATGAMATLPSERKQIAQLVIAIRHSNTVQRFTPVVRLDPDLVSQKTVKGTVPVGSMPTIFRMEPERNPPPGTGSGSGTGKEVTTSYLVKEPYWNVVTMEGFRGAPLATASAAAQTTEAGTEDSERAGLGIVGVEGSRRHLTVRIVFDKPADDADSMSDPYKPSNDGTLGVVSGPYRVEFQFNRQGKKRQDTLLSEFREMWSFLFKEPCPITEENFVN